VELGRELELVGEQLELARVQQQLGQELALDEERQLEQVLALEQVLEEQLRHRNHGQPLQASKRHRASTVCRRHFSTAGCRGQSASYRKQR
jgi:hypothetical protein